MTVFDGQEGLPEYLQRVRAERRLSLRDVERITAGKVSNGYLSQLEGGKIESPGIIILHTLSAAYGVDFEEMCRVACIGNRPSPSPAICPTCGQVTDEAIRRGR